MPSDSPKPVPLAGWGRYPRSQAVALRPERMGELRLPVGQVIARGQGRSYGDAALNAGRTVVLTERLNRMVSFDAATGVLRAEAGVTLGDILTTFVPRGWFLPVTPGTKYVSLGGAVACDVHGKNHHKEGGFGEYTRELLMMLADGSTVTCSPDRDPELFWATVGGMGLTGVILEVTVRLNPIRSAQIRASNHPVHNLQEALRLMSDPATDDDYSVCWLDTTRTGRSMGKGVLIVGHHAPQHPAPSTQHPPSPLPPHRRDAPRIPVLAPVPLLNRPAVRAFNIWYDAMNKAKGDYLCHYDPFFYPLDFVGGWNLLYGPGGLLQYQIVVPDRDAEAVLRDVLARLQRAGMVSFLTVLKRMGPEGRGYLSFPKEGWTLTLDMPIGKNKSLFAALDDVDRELVKIGGRVYLAKDSRLKPEAFAAMYPRLDAFRAVKRRVDPEGVFTSDLSRRLAI
ncbi:MAG: FAD-binding oxidoreductase [SAR202 cluster bacterium]|nr:FAD-binding oxidoreductase [SAR202 cluster bacterium]